MTEKNKDVQAHKNLLRQLEKDGLSVIPAIDDNEDFDNIEFKSCGDIKQDLENITKKTMKSQAQLFEMDQNYHPIHNEIKKLQAVKDDLDEFTDNYKIQLSQLNRVLQRIGKYIEDNKTTKDSTNEAIKATQSQQALMVSKISEKIAEIQAKLNKLNKQNEEKEGNDENIREEIKTYKEYLRGLEEFLAGLKKLRQTSESKIDHLDHVVTQLIEQRATINREIRNLKEKAVGKLQEIRNKYLKPNMQHLSDEYDNKQMEEQFNKSNTSSHSSSSSQGIYDEINNVQLPDYKENAPSTMVGLLHQREKYMNRVYKRIHDLESRALTTSSTDYLNSLTEIRELQLIFNNRKLKYFYNKFVASCNEVFNDCCLAYQAILEFTAEINSPLITQLKGVQLLNSVVNKSSQPSASAALNGQRNAQQMRMNGGIGLGMDEDGNIGTSQNQLEVVVDFVQSLPDREIVIMQVARYLSTSLPFRSFILGIKERKYRNMHFIDDQTEQEKKEKEKQESQSIYGDSNSSQARTAKQLVKIDEFVMNKIREWMGSILQIYGNNAFNSVKVALENDVVAQVRPSTAARLIVNCVYGLDVSW
eukprot:CAMPEP_0201579546 /NCGR_PEP_ID=MMETSP0190_2-20130828/27202_1 /ASSEMBLY_ACC=CAM_ASM_000263 /TAXON_ID=37353 /ORGANISM="Rosalina sp." /LENGTH=587 /DNA_ID=CAMNT_0048014153 /DNA_START=297 /DNA_END=2060 /DNA_ORIENTATION=-